MKTLLLLLASFLLCGAASAASPSSINNDDSCDVKVGPAATLLLPYFEVDVYGNSGRTTLFTITNVTAFPQIAHVTLWSDWAFPVLTFNLYLTGYGMQSVNMADVLKGSVLTSGTGAPKGPLSYPSNGNLQLAGGCGASSYMPANLAAAVRTALTTGVFNPGGGVLPCSSSGGVHINAIGYATVDVVSNCTSRFPTDPLYYANDLLYDNVLIGDYQQIGAQPSGSAIAGFEAGGNPMVHIRAVPEGGGAGSVVATNLPYTFYDRYTPKKARTIDRRQPLPSTFAARYIQTDSGNLATNFTIWREGFGEGACFTSGQNSDLYAMEVIRFDEHENASAFSLLFCEPCSPGYPQLPASSSASTTSSNFPSFNGFDPGGWMYLNLNNGGSTSYSVTRDVGGVSVTTTGPSSTSNLAPSLASAFEGPRPSQNWVTVSMFGKAGTNPLSVEFDAASLGNGCSPAAFLAQDPIYPLRGARYGNMPIGPAGGVFVCPPGTTLTNGSTTQCSGTNSNPPP